MLKKLMRPHQRPLYLAVAVCTALTVWVGHDAALLSGIAACHIGLAIGARP